MLTIRHTRWMQTTRGAPSLMDEAPCQEPRTFFVDSSRWAMCSTAGTQVRTEYLLVLLLHLAMCESSLSPRCSLIFCIGLLLIFLSPPLQLLSATGLPALAKICLTVTKTHLIAKLGLA